jgi:hypothetical protein
MGACQHSIALLNTTIKEASMHERWQMNFTVVYRFSLALLIDGLSLQRSRLEEEGNTRHAWAHQSNLQAT